MRVAIEAVDVAVPDEELSKVDDVVNARVRSSSFDGARDLRLRLRRTKNALLCIAAVGFSGGGLVTSTATGSSPFTAIVGALDELPARIDRVDGLRRAAGAAGAGDHAAVRETLRRLLDAES